jgi:hypothetical protein
MSGHTFLVSSCGGGKARVLGGVSWYWSWHSANYRHVTTIVQPFDSLKRSSLAAIEKFIAVRGAHPNTPELPPTWP